MSKIVQPYPGAINGALEDPVVVEAIGGCNYALHTDGRIFNCTRKQNGAWPIRYEVESHDRLHHFLKGLLTPPPRYTICYKILKDGAVQDDHIHSLTCSELETARSIYDTLVYARLCYEVVTQRP